MLGRKIDIFEVTIVIDKLGIGVQRKAARVNYSEFKGLIYEYGF